LVSAIIPTYNRAQVVGRAIESVQAQSYGPIEIIVVDDGSTDDTAIRLGSFGNAIRVVRQRNSGPAAARNAGVRASRGDIVSFLDSDDTWLPSKIETQMAVMEAAGPSICCCISNMTLHFKGGRTGTSFDAAGMIPQRAEGVWVNPAEVLITRFLMFNQCVAIQKKFFNDCGGFDERLKVLEDYDLAIRLAVRGPWAFVDQPLVEWKQSADSLSHVLRDSVLFRESWCSILEGAAASIPASSDNANLRRSAERASRAARLELKAWRLTESAPSPQAFLGNAYLRARRAWMKALRRSPWYPRMQTIPVNDYKSAFQSVGNANDLERKVYQTESAGAALSEKLS